jgi:hypothetical protein
MQYRSVILHLRVCQGLFYCIFLLIALAIVYSYSYKAVANYGDVLFDFYVACLAACPTTGHQELISKITRRELFDFMRVQHIIIVC